MAAGAASPYLNQPRLDVLPLFDTERQREVRDTVQHGPARAKTVRQTVDRLIKSCTCTAAAVSPALHHTAVQYTPPPDYLLYMYFKDIGKAKQTLKNKKTAVSLFRQECQSTLLIAIQWNMWLHTRLVWFVSLLIEWPSLVLCSSNGSNGAI